MVGSGAGRWSAAGAVVVAAVLGGAGVPAATAHETTSAGALQLTIGWRDEPALTGAANAVDLTVVDAAGAPVADPQASLVVQISTGDDRVTRPLTPAGEPGAFETPLLPTRAGVYRFHVTGTVAGTAVDLDSTCSEATFDCVTDPASIAFPSDDPSALGSAAELDERLDRINQRAESARDDATTARTWAAVALGVAGVAMAAAAARSVALVRSRKHVGS